MRSPHGEMGCQAHSQPARTHSSSLYSDDLRSEPLDTFLFILSWLGHCSPCIWVFVTIGVHMQKRNRVGSARARVA